MEPRANYGCILSGNVLESRSRAYQHTLGENDQRCVTPWGRLQPRFEAELPRTHGGATRDNTPKITHARATSLAGEAVHLCQKMMIGFEFRALIGWQIS